MSISTAPRCIERPKYHPLTRLCEKPKYHPRQWVDRSGPTYQSEAAVPVFIFLATRGQGNQENSNSQAATLLCRLDLNYTPTAGVEFRTFHTVSHVGGI